MIDIIVPVYNSGNTIARTLNSICLQKNKDDFYVYIVDDGSDESYDDLIKFFSTKMKIKLLKLKENSGPGLARQYGLDNSKGEFIIFMDSDDEFYDETSVLKLYNSIENNDICVGKSINILEQETIELYNENSLHGKMYRRKFLEDNKIKFNKYRSHEDNAFNRLCYICTENISFLDEIVYLYNYNSDSITNNQDLVENIDLYIKNMNCLFREIEKKDSIDKWYAGKTITFAFYYCYFNYMTNEKLFDFVFKKMSFLKEMYKKYHTFISESDELEVYKRFDYPVVPFLTISEFIRKIESL